MYDSNTIQYHKIRDKFARFTVLPTVTKYAKTFYECDSVFGTRIELANLLVQQLCHNQNVL